MQRFVLVLALAAVAVVVWWTLTSTPPRPALTPTGIQTNGQDPLSVPSDPGTGRILQRGGEPDPSGPDQILRPPETVDEPGKLQPGEATLTVVSRPDLSPVPAFRYQIVHADGRRENKQVFGHMTVVQLEMHRMATLRIEADGFEPSGNIRVQATDLDPNPSPRVELVRVPKMVGIRLTVLDWNQLPVPRVRLRLVARHPDREELLWERENSDAAGLYRMPDLRPGLYRIELKATDDTGTVLPLLPHSENIEFQGHEDQPILVQLRPAAQLKLSVRDADGGYLGPTVSARLLDKDGQPVPTVFSSALEGLRQKRLDGLPLPGPATLDTPVQAGNYTLQWRIGEGAVQTRPLVLSDGQTFELDLR